MRLKKVYATIALLAGLAACGETTGEQALYGAGAGFLGALVVDGDPLVGAVGGAATNVLYCQAGLGECS